MDISQWTVLVVEDAHDDASIISKILTYHGATVVHAENGKACVEMLDDLTPTMIITDLSMPEMDGWSTLEWVRSNPHTRDIPVMAVTAFHSSDVGMDVQSAGFDAYCPKPLHPKTFIEAATALIQ